jgi:hypothetical protein
MANVKEAHWDILRRQSDERIAELKKTNLDLEAQIQPRRLSPEQQSAIADTLRPFKGAKVDVISYALDAEASGLARQIKSSLETAGIEGIDKISGVLQMSHFMSAVIVTGAHRPLVIALQQSLAKIGNLQLAPERDFNERAPWIDTGDHPPSEDVPVNAVVFIGIKPIPMAK